MSQPIDPQDRHRQQALLQGKPSRETLLTPNLKFIGITSLQAPARPSPAPLRTIQVQLWVLHRAGVVDAALVLLAERDLGRLLVQPDAKA